MPALFRLGTGIGSGGRSLSSLIGDLRGTGLEVCCSRPDLVDEMSPASKPII